ncbi:tyrosine-type recombinase/integrase [Patescibacteria group bacterium]|nr:tyrosine-type recombinase/integrase [Patescibacteria group bacterium]
MSEETLMPMQEVGRVEVFENNAHLQFREETEAGGGGVKINVGNVTTQQLSPDPTPQLGIPDLYQKINELSKYLVNDPVAMAKREKEEKMANITIGESLDSFLEWAINERKFASSTITTYTDLIKRFIKHVGGREVKIADISPKTISSYKAKLQKKYAKSSVVYMMISIRWLFRFLFMNRLIKWDYQLITVPKDYFNKHFTVAEPEDIRRIIDGMRVENFRELRNKTILSFLVSSGVRNAELCDLKVSDLKIEKQYANIVSKKSDEPRMIFWDDLSKDLLERYLDERKLWAKCDNLFISTDNRRRGNKLTTRSIQRIVKDSIPKDLEVKKITPHSFRHAMGMSAVKAGIHSRYIQKILGHKNINSSQVYMRYYDTDVVDAYSKILDLRASLA